MGVELFKFREGCNDLVISHFLLDVQFCKTILSGMSTRIFFPSKSMATAN